MPNESDRLTRHERDRLRLALRMRLSARPPAPPPELDSASLERHAAGTLRHVQDVGSAARRFIEADPTLKAFVFGTPVGGWPVSK